MLRSWQGKTPQVHPTAFVSEAAYVVGDVEIGPYVNIWPGVVIRGDTGHVVIGENSCVQDNSTVHSEGACNIGPNVAIGHNVLCHADKVGQYVLIGNGAMVNGWVEIGDYCIIASGAVVLEHTVIPPYSLVVGVPAQVKGRLTDEQIERIKGTLRRYVERGQAYKAQGDLE
jgi:carbonic anhydrase/acetyltransferase-like protein (isoleucine patch superfamily)